MLPLPKFALSEAAVATDDEVARLTRGVDTLLNTVVSDSFRFAMRELASGVCVVTTGNGDARVGMTATSVTSLSMSPPSLLVCIQKTSATLAPLVENGSFAVNVLGCEQQAMADLFAGRRGVCGVQRFADPAWREGETGVPVLTSALASIECKLAQVNEWHSHCVLFGTATSVRVGGAGEALVYRRGRYAAPQDLN
jgi:flavin reductase (DIM6/NTAB) family NADH-FMN oxidoreductase RutF